MFNIKNQHVGFYLTLITLIAAVIGLVYSLINAGTDSFAKIGTSGLVIGCIVAAIVALVLYVILGSKESIVRDVMPVIAGVALMVAAAQFIVPRVNTIASIMTFTSNDQTMADLQSAIIAEAALVVAALVNMISAFTPVARN